MSRPGALQNPKIAISFVLLAFLAISINDMLIKLLSSNYPLHQMVFTRSAIGILFSLFMVQVEGGWRILKTSRPGLHVLRSCLLVFSNMTLFAALAVLPLAEATAVFFIAPLLITLLGVPILGEKVGPLRLSAVAVGFIGVLIMTEPWNSTTTRDVALTIYALPVVGAFAYALNQVLTRKLGAESKASALAVYVQGGFIVASALFWLIAGDGRFAPSPENESLYFILRSWSWPQGNDIWIFLALGFNASIIGYGLSQAYRMADAATVAPFEYIGLPLAIFWGWLIWGDLPGPFVSVGITLILGSGLFVYLRERVKKPGLHPIRDQRSR